MYRQVCDVYLESLRARSGVSTKVDSANEVCGVLGFKEGDVEGRREDGGEEMKRFGGCGGKLA